MWLLCEILIMIEYNRHFLLVGLVPRVVWTVRWWSGVVVCFVQLSTLVCSVLQSIPYQGVVLPILFSLNSILGHCFVYVSFMMFWVVLMVFLLCSVTCCSVLCCCSDDVRPLLIGVFELRIGVNSNTPFDSQSCIHRCCPTKTQGIAFAASFERWYTWTYAGEP